MPPEGPSSPRRSSRVARHTTSTAKGGAAKSAYAGCTISQLRGKAATQRSIDLAPRAPETDPTRSAALRSTMRAMIRATTDALRTGAHPDLVMSPNRRPRHRPLPDSPMPDARIAACVPPGQRGPLLHYVARNNRSCPPKETTARLPIPPSIGYTCGEQTGARRVRGDPRAVFLRSGLDRAAGSLDRGPPRRHP
jgi:hypothetical protein